MKYAWAFLLFIMFTLTSMSCTASTAEIATSPEMTKTQNKILPATPTITTVPTHTPTPTVTPVPSYWEPGLVYFDDFDDLNRNIWTPLRRKDSYNNELQYYRPQNVKVRNGHLLLTAKKEKLGDRRYTSGLVNTLDKLEIQYGRIDVRAKHPRGKGLFSAIWLSPTSDDYLPEIDIMEVLGDKPSKIWVVNHYRIGKEFGKSFNGYYIDDTHDFHIYTIKWSKDELIWLVDNVEVHKTNEGIPQEPMHLILNLAVGGDWPKAPNADTPFPSSFVIDYVKVFEEGY